MAAAISIVNTVFDGFWAPFQGVDPIYGLIAFSLLTGILMGAVFRMVSNQEGIRRTKRLMQGHLLEMRLYGHDLRLTISAMGHLLPLLGKLDFTWVNFGPTLTVSEIRDNLPRAAISGQLAPFAYMRNESERIVLECLRDFEMAGDGRGLIFAPAGSISQGTRLTSMRRTMAARQRYGRYKPV